MRVPAANLYHTTRQQENKKHAVAWPHFIAHPFSVNRPGICKAVAAGRELNSQECPKRLPVTDSLPLRGFRQGSREFGMLEPTMDPPVLSVSELS